jgi:peptidoglycan/LPS O-acetylase OafA/YrhL
MGWLGLISYGVFLWHHPIAIKLSEVDHHSLFGSARMLGITGVTLVIAIAAATLSYYLVERPILRFKDRPFRRVRTPAPAASQASRTAG